MTKTTTNTKTHTKCQKTQYMLYFWNPDDLLIPNMTRDTSPWSSCSSQSPWLPCSGHTISSTGPSVSPFRDFYKRTWSGEIKFSIKAHNWRCDAIASPVIFRNFVSFGANYVDHNWKHDSAKLSLCYIFRVLEILRKTMKNLGFTSQEAPLTSVAAPLWFWIFLFWGEIEI